MQTLSLKIKEWMLLDINQELEHHKIIKGSKIQIYRLDRTHFKYPISLDHLSYNKFLNL